MAYREITDEQERRWRVWDTHPQNTAVVRAEFVEGWLCFESETEKHRLAPIPPGWFEATDARLRLLLRAARESGMGSHGDEEKEVEPA